MLSELFSEQKFLDDLTDGQLSDGEPPTCYNIGLGARGTVPRRNTFVNFFFRRVVGHSPCWDQKAKGQANVRIFRVWKSKVENGMPEVVHFDSVGSKVENAMPEVVHFGCVGSKS